MGDVVSKFCRSISVTKCDYSSYYLLWLIHLTQFSITLLLRHDYPTNYLWKVNQLQHQSAFVYKRRKVLKQNFLKLLSEFSSINFKLAKIMPTLSSITFSTILSRILQKFCVSFLFIFQVFYELLSHY